MKTHMFGPRPAPTGRLLPRRGAIVAFVAVTELSVCLTVFAVLAVALAFVDGGAGTAASAAPGEFHAIRRLATVGPAGDRIAVLTDDSCVVRDLSGDDTFSVWVRAGDDRVTAIAGRPDGLGLAVGWCDGRTQVVDTALSEPRWERRFGDRPISSAAFSPDGSTLAVGTEPGEVLLLDAATGEPRHRLVTDGDVRTIAFTPCGRWLVVPSAGGTLSLVHAATATESRRIPAMPGTIVAMAIHPRGHAVAVANDQGELAVVDLTEASITRRDMDGYLPALSLAFSPDGERLLVGAFERRIRIFSADASRELGGLSGHQRGTRALLPSRDGMLSAGFDGRLVAWDLATAEGREILTN